MTRRQKLTWCLGSAAVLGVSAIAVTMSITGREGSSALEQWIGQQIVGVLEGHTTMTASFSTLDYQAPGTVVVTGMTMSGGGEELVAADRLLLELAEPPVPGKPIQIQRIELDAPRLRFVQADGGGFVGWNGIIPPAVAADPETVEEGHRLSDVLVLRHVAIRDGQLVYDAGDGTEPMVLRGLTTALDTIPDAEQPGWYNLDGKLSREPVFNADVDARINLDTSVLDIEPLALSVVLGTAQYEVFPPRVQSMLRDHEVQGNLTVNLTGSIPLKQFESGKMDLDVTLRDARLALGDKILPVEHVGIKGVLADAVINIDCDARLLDGRFVSHIRTNLTGDRPMRLTWDIADVKIERTLRAIADGPARYAGTVRSNGQLDAALARWPDAASGGGTLNIDNGRLVLLPGMSDLLRLIGSKNAKAKGAPKDRADLVFDFEPGGMRVTEGEMVSSYLAARVRGMIYFDGQLDLEVNAGPLEKVQSMLGKAGKLFGQITDKVITYRIHGPMSAPEVGVKPFAADLRD